MYERKCQGPFRVAQPLILASASPRRRELLRSLGLDFRIVPSPVEEPLPMAGESCDAYARRVCEIKARAVSVLYPDAVTLAADTIVVVDDEVLGKPADRADAVKMLTRLSGRSHTVITYCAVIWPEKAESHFFSRKTTVWIGKYPADVLGRYVDCGESMDKAGSYAVQGVGAFMVERIQGSYTNVVGLPVDAVVSVLMKMGVLDINGV